MKIFKNFWILAVLCMAVVMGFTACSGDEESISDALERDNKNITAYWGEDMCWLNGFWVEEQDVDNPNAGYTEITASGWSSVNMLESNRVCSGHLATRLGNINSVGFSKNSGSTYWFYIKWADATKKRLEMYQEDAKGNPIKETKNYWVKIDKKPSAWQ